MKLYLEQLEERILLAVPIKPFAMDLLAAWDSGVNDDDITNLNNGTLELIAETDGTVAVYNAGYLGDATEQNDTLFYESGGTVVIEAEKGTIVASMATGNAVGGFEGTGYIYSSGNNDGTATYQFYITTADTYYVYARTYFSALNRNSFYVNIDDTWVGGTGPAIWDNTEDAWHISTAVADVDVAGPAYTWVLATGWHTMEIHAREKNTRLDRIIISNVAAPGDPGGAESATYETFQYTFGAGDLIGSTYGTDNSITAKVTTGGGTSPLSDPLVITYDDDTITPAAPDLDIGSDTGVSNIDNLTSDTSATFTGVIGSAEPGSTVWLRVGTVNKHSATANADGSYSVDLQIGDLAEIPNNAVDIIYIDLAGNTSADSADLTVGLDATANAPAGPPDLDVGSDTGSSNSDDLTNDTTATFTGGAGSVEADSTVWLRVGAANTRSATAAGDGSYSVTLQSGDLAEGANVVDIIYIDEAGNTSADSANLTVTLDTTANAPGAAPDLDAGSDTGSSNSDNITSDTTATFSGIAGIVEDDSTVWLRVGGVNTRSATAAGDGSYSVTLLAGDLSEGGNTVDIIYIDEAGNTSSDSANLTVTLDTKLATPSAPDLRSASDTGGNADNVTSDNAAWFDGYAERGAAVQIFVGAIGEGTDTADAATGAWSIQLDNGDLAAGANDITITATDTAGNSQSSAALVVTYDAVGT
ncbi:MAG: hypothetical protein KAT56_07450, partial [Sedimentisphaerales bacterium]|nr:hypothetical protein [Sedimentisphaerales bacterium]